MWHLYEVVISNSRVWLKVQASGEPTEQLAAFFEARFNGSDHIPVDGHHRVTPFRLAERSHYIANWASIVDRLPAGWDDDELQIEGSPYPWCETLSDDCDCHGAKGRLDEAFCSDFGLHDEADKRARKTENVRHQHVIRRMKEGIARRDEARREAARRREERSPRPSGVAVEAKPIERAADLCGARDLLAKGVGEVNRLAAQGFYCSIHSGHHAYGNRPYGKRWRGLPERARNCRRGMDLTVGSRCRRQTRSPRTGFKCINQKSVRRSLCGVTLKSPESCTSTFPRD